MDPVRVAHFVPRFETLSKVEFPGEKGRIASFVQASRFDFQPRTRLLMKVAWKWTAGWNWCWEDSWRTT